MTGYAVTDRPLDVRTVSTSLRPFFFFFFFFPLGTASGQGLYTRPIIVSLLASSAPVSSFDEETTSSCQRRTGHFENWSPLSSHLSRCPPQVRKWVRNTGEDVAGCIHGSVHRAAAPRNMLCCASSHSLCLLVPCCAGQVKKWVDASTGQSTGRITEADSLLRAAEMLIRPPPRQDGKVAEGCGE